MLLHVTPKSAKSIELNPTTPSGQDLLFSLLRRKDKSSAIAGTLDELVEKLEKVLHSGADDTALILRTLALVLVHHPVDPEPWRALNYARRAVEATHGTDAAALATLAEVQFVSGQRADAVLTLESALTLPHLPPSMEDQIAQYREAIRPCFPSYASFDSALSLEVIIPEGAAWRYFPGKREPSAALEWTAPDFDDSSWKEGPSGFGYGDGDDNSVLADMQGSYSTLYLRHSFMVPDPARCQGILLSVRADDGFVAYVNGVEVARERAGEAGAFLPFDALASEGATEPLEASERWLDLKLLRAGRNVLALEGLNMSPSSSDFSLILVLKAKYGSDPDRARDLLEKFRAVAGGTSVRDLLAYAEGRFLQLSGKPREAIERFHETLDHDRRSAGPLLRSAECLRVLGEPSLAEKELHEGLEKGFSGEREVWNLWLAISFVDLHRTPAEILSGFPAGAPSAYGGDLRWLLGELASGRRILINCGGADYRGKDGTWGRDRFFLGGYRYREKIHGDEPFAGAIALAEDPSLYQTVRWFPGSESSRAGYRIPLPPGHYRVTLHFAEIWQREDGKRRFDVRLEGEEALSDYQLFAKGFATATHEEEEAVVKDGFLDIEFVRKVDDPLVSALEIQRMD